MTGLVFFFAALFVYLVVRVTRGTIRELASTSASRDALRNSEQNFRSLIENALDVVAILKSDGTIRYVSPSVESVLGYTPDHMTGKSAFGFFHPEDAPKFVDAFKRTLQDQAAPKGNLWSLRFLHEDGSWRWLEAINSRIVDESGAAGIVVNARDITDRERASRTANELALFPKLNPGPILRFVESGKVNTYNPAAERVWSKNDLESGSMASLIPDLGAIDIGQFIQDGAEATRETQVDGTTYQIALVGVPDLRICVAFATDITERKRAEEALAASIEDTRLFHSTARAAATMDSFDEALQQCLDLVCRYVGWPVGHVYVMATDGTGELEPAPVWHLDDPIAFQVFREVTEQIRFAPGVGLPGRVLSSGKPAWITDVQEEENFPRNKEARDIGVRGAFAFPISIGGQTVAVLEFFTRHRAETDEHILETMAGVGSQFSRLFERKRAQEDLETAYRELKELDAMKDTFLSTVSHELRTPLTSIRGSAEILLSYGDVDEETRTEFLTIIDDESQRLTRLINDVLDLARIEAGLQQWESTIFEVSEAIETVAMEVSSKSV